MEYILDTQVLLWLIFDSDKLSDVFVKKHICVSSLWEISIKNRIGKLPLPEGTRDIFSAVRARGFGVIGLDYLHIEKMTIITTDENIQKYDVPWIW